MSKDNRYRQWAFVVYPESATPNWKDVLDDTHVPWYESPLHDSDKNPTGEAKKAHWHVIIQFSGKKDYNAIKELTDSINATRPEPVKEIKGYLRYFAHLDNPEKAQYDPNKIVPHNGADMSYLTTPTASERHKIINDMRRFCREKNVTEFSDLLDLAAETHPTDWFPVLCDSGAYVMEMYVRSLRHGQQSGSVDQETGEVIYKKRGKKVK